MIILNLLNFLGLLLAVTFIARLTQLAQKLYEGVELSDGKAVGLITYIRTDGLHVGITLVARI